MFGMMIATEAVISFYIIFKKYNIKTVELS